MSRMFYALCSLVLLTFASQAAPPLDELKGKLEKLGATVTTKDGVIVQVSVKAADFTPDDFKLLNQCKALKN